MNIEPPKTLSLLQTRCQQLAGLSLGTLARHLHDTPPQQLHHAKGWVGQLMEKALGATGGAKALHDFPNLAIELKTIPVNHALQPIESTYVCTVNTNYLELDWANAWVHQKLKHVLWIPILSDPTLPIDARKIGAPFFWKPDQEFLKILKQDWEELMEFCQLGQAHTVTARYGTLLQIRPKAAHSRVVSHYLDQDCQPTKLNPRGFYLRTAVTQKILSQQFGN